LSRANFKVGDRVIYSREKVSAKYANSFPGTILKIISDTKIVVLMTGPQGQQVEKTVSKTRLKREPK
jgi:hypothetical protein